MYADTYPLPPIIARDTTEARKLSTQQEMSAFLAEVERRAFKHAKFCWAAATFTALLSRYPQALAARDAKRRLYAETT